MFHHITTINDPVFMELWELYEKAFPLLERRTLTLQKLILNHRSYYCNAIFIDNQFVGLILWWQLGDVIYIEHFAIEEEVRGNGIGMDVLEAFKNKAGKRIILEVELPTTEIGRRRIEFYQRAGFSLNTYKYFQLPLRPKAKKVELLLMSYSETLSLHEFKEFTGSFRNICFEPFKHLIDVNEMQ
ncbi:GNAT family N-acetyltransferase [Carboxylicivirga litoralis]|uniref:GNAT family N-acetyltransferase n=1 Tax=Carboxylicivirga litoralis TaxID=2816963 RepID=UPI0021CB1AC1|nr:GNAT family N-acetyltransferase [Carboxylicivirga sp. A043]